MAAGLYSGSTGLYSGHAGLSGGNGLYSGAAGLQGGSGGASLSTLEQLTSLIAGTNSAIWLPNDLANLRQTSSGETAVVATDPVGFVADVSEFGGLNLNEWLATQPNLVTNGDFSSTDVSDWTRGSQSVDGTLEVVGGKLVHTKGASDSTNPRWYKQITASTTSGRWYYAQMDPVAGTAGTARMDLVSNKLGSVANAITPSGRFIQAANNTLYLVAVTQGGSAGDTAIYDNLVVKEMPANFHPLLQATTSLKPDATNGLTFDGVDDCLDISTTLPSDASFVAGIALTAINSEVPIADVSGTTGYAAWVASGGATAATSTGSAFVDGVAAATQGDLATAIGAGGVFHRLENRGGDFSTWSGVRLGKRSNTFQQMNGALSAIILLDNVGLGANAATALSLAQTLVDEINGAM